MNTKYIFLGLALVGMAVINSTNNKNVKSQAETDSTIKGFSDTVQKILETYYNSKGDLGSVDVKALVTKGVKRIHDQKAMNKPQSRPWTALLQDEKDFNYLNKSAKVQIYQLEQKIYDES